MENRYMFRRPVYLNGNFIGFKYFNVENWQTLTDIKDATNQANWVYGALEQCTGKKDKNGVLVYDNDYLVAGNIRYQVKWSNFGWRLYTAGVSGYPMGSIDLLEKVGSIHEKQS